ncbi:MAG: flavodoxin family protein [Christensenellaceae bacterium]
MNILLLNGSPHKNGCTFTALNEVAGELNRQGIGTEFLHIGTKPVMGCIGCGKCVDDGHCFYQDDMANECIDRLLAADGIVIGSPVYYSGPNGALCALLDRVFYAPWNNGDKSFAHKLAASVVNCRRGGASAAFERLNQFFLNVNMVIVGSQYWNSTHGMSVDEVKQDVEGLQTMRTLAKNMAWLLKCIRSSEKEFPVPETEPWTPTNFIR